MKLSAKVFAPVLVIFFIFLNCDLFDTTSKNSPPSFDDSMTLSFLGNNIDIGTQYTRQLSATDPDNDDLTYSASQHFSISGNSISWKPTISDVGQHCAWIKVTDPDDKSDSIAWTITVYDTTSSSTNYYLHVRINTTTFWVGEEANEANGWIHNNASAWDIDWEIHYGGEDSMNNRNGYHPALFTPKENPFYFALPYADFNRGGGRKPEVRDIVPWFSEGTYGELDSPLKNRWARIIRKDLHGTDTAYAQWEDVGPFSEDDKDYVFGTAIPKSIINSHAGLDVSPAVATYLDLDGNDFCSWQFVDDTDVPAGPWKEIITTTGTNW